MDPALLATLTADVQPGALSESERRKLAELRAAPGSRVGKVLRASEKQRERERQQQSSGKVTPKEKRDREAACALMETWTVLPAPCQAANIPFSKTPASPQQSTPETKAPSARKRLCPPSAAAALGLGLPSLGAGLRANRGGS